jgi:hypothetical protein
MHGVILEGSLTAANAKMLNRNPAPARDRSGRDQFEDDYDHEHEREVLRNQL